MTRRINPDRHKGMGFSLRAEAIETIGFEYGGSLPKRGFFVARFFYEATPAKTERMVVYEATEARRANYFAGQEMDRLHDEDGRRWGYEVKLAIVK